MNIQEQHIHFLEKYIKNIDQLLISDNINDLLLAIDDAIIDTFDSDGNPDSAGIKLQNIYDEIYSNG